MIPDISPYKSVTTTLYKLVKECLAGYTEITYYKPTN